MDSLYWYSPFRTPQEMKRTNQQKNNGTLNIEQGNLLFSLSFVLYPN